MRGEKMLLLLKLINKNVKGGRLQFGFIYGPNPKKATAWCNQLTGPKSKDFNNTKILENNGLWGVQNAKKSAFRNYTWLGS
jgi:hypothetical protein